MIDPYESLAELSENPTLIDCANLSVSVVWAFLVGMEASIQVSAAKNGKSLLGFDAYMRRKLGYPESERIDRFLMRDGSDIDSAKRLLILYSEYWKTGVDDISPDPGCGSPLICPYCNEVIGIRKI